MFKTLRNKLFFIFLIYSYSISIIQAAVPNFDNRTSFVGPTGKAKYSQLITQNSAFSLLGEAGPRNYRLGGTLGLFIQDNQRIKFSGEFLRQDIIYSFFSGNTRKWVQQGAIGAQYQYDLYQYRYLPQFNLKAAYSHAPSKQLDSIASSYINALGLPQNYINDRRIAGSNAGFFSPGLSIQPWQTGRFGVELNYDDVQYDGIYSFQGHGRGFGGSANLIQKIGANTEVGVSVGIREPFNAYQANIAYILPNHPGWTLGLDGNYVEGKHYLPNTYNVGIRVSYLLKEGQFNPNNLENEPSIRPVNGELSSWTTDPAIYLPQVLAITDETVIIPIVTQPTTPAPSPAPAPEPVCIVPILVAPIPTQNTVSDFTLAIAPFFSGTSPFTFSVSFTGTVPAGTTVTINPSTGLLSVHPVNNGTNYSFNVTVIATNSCGTASTTFLVNAPFDSGLG